TADGSEHCLWCVVSSHVVLIFLPVSGSLQRLVRSFSLRVHSVTLLHRWDKTQLLIETKRLDDDPVLNDASALNTVLRHCADGDLAAGWRNTLPQPAVRASHRDPRNHLVATGAPEIGSDSDVGKRCQPRCDVLTQRPGTTRSRGDRLGCRSHL